MTSRTPRQLICGIALLIALTALVFALSGAVAGADPPSWAHGHDGGQQGGGGGPPPWADGNGPAQPAQASPAPSGSPGQQPGDGAPPGQGDGPAGHGGTPPGHGGSPPGHDGNQPGQGRGHGPRAEGQPGATASAAPAPAPAPTPTPAQTPNTPAVPTPAVPTPAVPTPAVPTPITTPVLSPGGTATPVTASPRPSPSITTTLQAIPSRRRSAGRPGAATASGTAVSGALLGNPLTIPLAPSTAGVASQPAPVTVLHHPGQRVRTIVVPPSSNPATVIERFISKIPAAVWIALAAAIGLAAMTGGAAVVLGRRASRRAAEVAAVTAAASTDQLTGVLNRRGFTEAAARELERARRYGHPLALAYVDVRGLKAVNDSEGHLAGDRLLSEVAVLLSRSARAHDLVGRMGGDELAVLLAEQAEPGAAAMTRRVRDQIPAHRSALGLRTDWDVTIGTASFPDDGETLDDLLAAADRRLYEQRGIELRAG